MNLILLCYSVLLYSSCDWACRQNSEVCELRKTWNVTHGLNWRTCIWHTVQHLQVIVLRTDSTGIDIQTVIIWHFSSIHRRLCQSRTVHRRVDGQGRGRFVRTPEAEETVLQYVGNNPSAYSRYRTALSRVMSQSGEFCRKCCYVRTTLREFILLHQLTIHPQCTFVIGIWTRSYSKQACCDGTKNWIHPDNATLEWAFFFLEWRTFFYACLD